jgi:hypothetical protein
VQVAERDIVRVCREVRGLDAVVEDRLRVALAAAQRRAAHEAVCGEKVDGVGFECAAQRADQRAHALGVHARGLGGVELEELLGAHGVALRDERHEHQPHRLARGGLERDDATVLGAGRVAEHGDARGAVQGCRRVEQVLVVVIAADRDDERARGPEREQGFLHHLLRLGRRRRRFEQVAGDEHEVDLFGRRDLGDLREHRSVLIETRPAAQRCADVPVGGVQQPHGDAPGSPS